MGPSLLVAFLAGCGNVLLTNPIWTVATRMQVRAPLYDHCQHCIRVEQPALQL